MTSPILTVSNLTTSFRVEGKWKSVVRNISFDIKPKETLAVVGESGSGKSVTALSIMRLTPPGSSKIEGSIKLNGKELLTLPDADMRHIRGNEIAMIFQEPMTSLNPVLTIGHQIAETLVLHRGMTRAAAMERTVELLRLVHIPEAARRATEYPHQMSGGMRQRVMIAMALACDPKLLIADEPTTALDVTIQAQILDLMRELQAKTGTAILLITHDLGVVAEMAQRVVVMYAGRKVEEAPVGELFAHPRHPYTRGLMSSMPRLGSSHGARERLQEIPGMVPSLREPLAGCAFAARCAYAVEGCRADVPSFEPKAPGHAVACFEADRLPPVLRP